MEPYFPDLKEEFEKSRFKISSQEYIANALFASFANFYVTLPFLAFSISLLLHLFFSAYLTSITLAIAYQFVF